jgi:alkanesulfonate monooxygenase SsuD/methylene tetrahydromethanopterin reductase-like flavin-dependent oxidoreductase (luciferase family)
MRFGFLSFGDLTEDPIRGGTPTVAQRLRDVLEAAELAESLGLDSFGVGEHHSARWGISAPPVVLAAIAARTRRIRLRTGVTLSANLDPVRVAEDYATVDVLSNGRLDLTAAKGNFPQPWVLFGQNVDEQRERLAEGIDLLIKIWSQEPVNWEGRFRPPLVNASVGPRPIQQPPRVWCGVATSPASVEFAAQRGLPLMVASVFRSPDHVASLIEHYRERAALAGHGPAGLEVAVATHLYVREDGDQARREFETYHRHALDQARTGAREALPPIDYDELFSSKGAFVCGTPAEAAEKLAWLRERYQHDVHEFHADLGGMPWSEVRTTMELFATEVRPLFEAAVQTAAVA